jgi:predicted amidohydrolase
MPTAPFAAAALQFRVDVGDVPGNRERAFRLLREAAERGARLCVLPEMWSTGFAEGELRSLSGTTPTILHAIREFAASRNIVVAGSLPERVGRGVYNTLYVVNANGVVTGQYRKAHLFTPSGEDRWFRRGTSARGVPTDAGIVGPLICYDLRFPELPRKYFLEGATIFCVSAQWPSVRSAQWEILAAARAVESQLHVVAANAVGPSGPFRYAGGSGIWSPTGERLASAGGEEGMALATIDPAAVEETRRRIPCLADRNERAYRKTRRPG